MLMGLSIESNIVTVDILYVAIRFILKLYRSLVNTFYIRFGIFIIEKKLQYDNLVCL